jgi:hypothetical protein
MWLSDGNISTDDNDDSGDDNFQVSGNNEGIHYRNVSKGFVIHSMQINKETAYKHSFNYGLLNYEIIQ